jgi:hypothetical protein
MGQKMSEPVHVRVCGHSRAPNSGSPSKICRKFHTPVIRRSGKITLQSLNRPIQFIIRTIGCARPAAIPGQTIGRFPTVENSETTPVIHFAICVAVVTHESVKLAVLQAESEIVCPVGVALPSRQTTKLSNEHKFDSIPRPRSRQIPKLLSPIGSFNPADIREYWAA